MYTAGVPNACRFAALVVLTTAALLAGCAGSTPKARFSEGLASDTRIDGNDTVTVKVNTSPGVSMLDHEKQRLAQAIIAKTDVQKRKNAAVGGAAAYELAVVLTRYEKGNAFARFMLAGLGQIHIDASVAVLGLPTRKQIAKFDVKKTFAWGGVYGGTTSMEDIEVIFAQGIAEAVTNTGQ